MATANEIVNMAIAMVGGNFVDEYTDTSDQSTEAVLARLFYTMSVNAVFEIAEWVFAFTIVVPDSEDITETSQDDVFTYRISRTSDMANIVAVSEDGTFKDNVVWKATASHIYTQAETVYIKYVDNTVSNDDWPELFTSLVASYIATKLAFPISKDMELTKNVRNQFLLDLDIAQTPDMDQDISPDTTNNVRIIDCR